MAISLDTSIQYLTGVGPKRAALYQKLDIHTVRDLLYYFPRSYIDLTAPCDIAAMPLFEQCAVRARVVAKSAPQYIRRGMTLFRVKVADDSGSMVITFFNAKYAVEALKYDTEYIFYGRSGGTLTRREMASPSIYPADLPNALIPVYPLTQGLSSKMVGANIAQALQLLGEELDDPIPDFIRQEYHLCHLQFALRNIHLPTDRESAEIARRRLIFEELLMLALSLRSVRDDTYTQTSYVCGKADLQPFFDQLPFTLTGAQQRAINQVRQDLAKNTPMNRLVQGDVGSGKTMVAAAASYIAFQNHYMSALMAPTEILAQQHYHGLSRLLEPLGMRLGLLCGSMTAKEKRDIKERIALGMVDLVIGTHALISKDVDLPNLALVVTDEQHRFGVRQRASLSEKSNHPHTLVMSATPIPRTLALMIYGDLDLSVLDELPPGRQKVDPFAVDSSYRQRIYAFIRKPLLHLLYRVGIVQRSQFFHCLCQFRAGAPVHLNGLPYQFHIQPHAAVVDLLVEMVFLPHAVRHGIFGEPCLDGHLRLHIADVISFERQPFVQGVFGKVAGALTIGLCWRTGLAEIFNEVFALRQLLFFQSQHSAGPLQR